jgi:hypothetical protein
MILQCIDGLRGDLHVTFEEGTWAAWLYDLTRQLRKAVFTSMLENLPILLMHHSREPRQGKSRLRRR